MSKGKKKSAQTAATVQSANTNNQVQNTTVEGKAQELDSLDIQIIKLFKLLDEEGQEEITKFVYYLDENRDSDKSPEELRSEWMKSSEYWERITAKEVAS